MPTGVTTVRGLPIEEAITGRCRAMLDEGSDPLYIRISRNTVRRVAKAQGWTVISDLTYAGISAALYAIREAGRTKKTRDNTLAVLSELLDWAKKNGHIPENPCDLIERVHARGEIETDAPRALLWLEAERLEDVARAKEAAGHAIGRFSATRADLYRALRFTGRRVGEWVPKTIDGKKDDAIRVRDVRLDTKPFPTLTIRPTVNKSRRKLTLPLHPAIVETLRGVCAGKHPEAYVFETQPDTETWANDIADAGIDELTADGIASLHSLRKTFNTMLAVVGADTLERKLLMGHAVDQDLTDGTYLDKNQLQAKLYTALCKLPGGKSEKSAQERLTCAGRSGDTESVTSATTPSRHSERRPAAEQTSHLPVVGRPSLSRDTQTCAPGRRSFDGLGVADVSQCPEKDSNLLGAVVLRAIAQDQDAPLRIDPGSVHGAAGDPSPAAADPSSSATEARDLGRRPCAHETHGPGIAGESRLHAGTSFGASSQHAGGATPRASSELPPAQAGNVGVDAPAPDAIAFSRSALDQAEHARNNGEVRSMKAWKKAAAFALLASVAGAQPDVTRMLGYSSGKDCHDHGTPHLAPTVAECIDRCDAECPQWYLDCAVECAGGSPENFVRKMRQASASLHARTGDVALAARIIETGMRSSDARIRRVAEALGAETPFVKVHNEQGEPSVPGVVSSPTLTLPSFQGPSSRVS